jgi:hypothetical protein
MSCWNNDPFIFLFSCYLEHAYTLTNLQAYSLSTRVDVTAGLPWLTVCVPGSQSAYTGGESYLEERFGITGQGQNHDASGSCSQVPEESDNDTHQYIYPPHLRHHEPLAFLKTGLLSPILNQFTFKSRQTFHRPPIHYSSDELLDFINQGLVATQDDDVVDEVDLKVKATCRFVFSAITITHSLSFIIRLIFFISHWTGKKCHLCTFNALNIIASSVYLHLLHHLHSICAIATSSRQLLTSSEMFCWSLRSLVVTETLAGKKLNLKHLPTESAVLPQWKWKKSWQATYSVANMGVRS